jgi:hypothetical protein
LRVTPTVGAGGAFAARAAPLDPVVSTRPTTAATATVHHPGRRDNGYFTGTTAPHVYGTLTE